MSISWVILSIKIILLNKYFDSYFIIYSLTLSQALLFADTDYSFETVLNLIDRDVYDELRYINEFPLLTALARNQNPSENLINKLKEYLRTKSVQDFKYLNKLYLVYSSLIKTRCSKIQCDSKQLVSVHFLLIIRKIILYFITKKLI